MSLTWSSVGHAFASGFSAIAKGAKYLGKEVVKIESAAPTVEGLSALIPFYGNTAVKLEQLAFAGLGMVAAGLHYGGDAFEKNLLDNGVDQQAITEIKQIIQQFPNLIQDIEAVFGKPKASTAAPVAAVNTIGVTEVVPPQVVTQKPV